MNEGLLFTAYCVRVRSVAASVDVEYGSWEGRGGWSGWILDLLGWRNFGSVSRLGREDLVSRVPPGGGNGSTLLWSM